MIISIVPIKKTNTVYWEYWFPWYKVSILPTKHEGCHHERITNKLKYSDKCNCITLLLIEKVTLSFDNSGPQDTKYLYYPERMWTMSPWWDHCYQVTYTRKFVIGLNIHRKLITEFRCLMKENSSVYYWCQVA